MDGTLFRRCGLVILVAFLLAAGFPELRDASAAATTWHVATTGSDTTGDGSRANPYATIQHAIDAARAGDAVLVQPGVYGENVDFKGKDLTVASRFLSTGDEYYISETVIDGGRRGHVVTFASGEIAPQLIGFTITNGYATGASPADERGGGILCWESGSPRLAHLRVIGNEAAGEGGGLFFAHCAPVVRDVFVAYNRAGADGGGMRYSYGSIDAENLVVVGNAGASGGSGMFFYHADGTVRNALIADNFGGGKGGGLGFDGCSPTFVNVTIAGNRTTGHGGGLNISYMSGPTLVNSIVWGNRPEQVYFDPDWFGEAITVDHSDVQGGEAGIVTNDLGPVYWQEGNLVAPPRFVSAALGDYRLGDRSPAIGAGKADGAPKIDVQGSRRPDPPGSNPDLGAYREPASDAAGRATAPGVLATAARIPERARSRLIGRTNLCLPQPVASSERFDRARLQYKRSAGARRTAPAASCARCDSASPASPTFSTPSCGSLERRTSTRRWAL